MKKTFIICILLLVISGILSGFQYQERKEYLDNLPVLLEPLAEVEVTEEAPAVSAPAEEVPVFNGVCS